MTTYKLLFLMILGGLILSCSNLDESFLRNNTEDELIFSETLTSKLGRFVAVNESGDQMWHIDGNGYAYMSGYDADSRVNSANEAWLISPEIDLGGLTEARLIFDHVARHFANPAEEATVWVSTNYVDGTLPSAASWTRLVDEAFVDPGNWNFGSSGEISLTAYAGSQIRIGFKYISTEEKAGTWELKNFVVKKGEAVVVTPTWGNGVEESPYTVEGVLANYGGLQWITGYVVGYVWPGASPTYVFNADSCTQLANILIADTTDTYIAKTFVVQLPAGDIRNGLNLKDNKSLLGTRVVVAGMLENDPNSPGMAKTQFYKLDDGTSAGVKPRVLFYESLTRSLGAFTAYNVSGEDKWRFDSRGYALVTGFVNSENRANEAWLVSSEIDLSGVEKAKFSFDHVARYFANPTAEATVWVSEDFSNNPATATWKQVPTLPFADPGSWTFGPSGELSLTAYAGKKIHIGLKYISTTTKAGSWEVKNFIVQEGEAPQLPGLPVFSESFYNNSQGAFTIQNVVMPGDVSYVWKPSASYGMVASAYVGGSNKITESWLLSPVIDLSSVSDATLTFEHALNFLNGSPATTHATVWVSTTYSSGLPGTAAWSRLTVPVYPAGSNWTSVGSGNIPLDDFVGEPKVVVAFKYVSTSVAAPTWQIKNLVIRQ